MSAGSIGGVLRIVWAILFVLACTTATLHPQGVAARAKPAIDELIPWLLRQNGDLHGVPFSQVIFDTTGRRVLPVEKENPVHQRVIKAVASALDDVVKQLNGPTSSIQQVTRINEVSSHFEDGVRERLNTVQGLRCEIPPAADGHLQRSGYPDLKLTEKESGSVFYLDPKLYAQGSRDSSFRTFYFEPKVATNKVRDDAVHLILGFEHEPRENAGHWNFTRWDIVDLSHFQVKLKAEFQGSNRDMYRPDAIVATSAK